MKIELKSTSIKDVIDNWDKIDPKPQYQRTPVWKIDRKKLLIDSIFKGYDLPKFYLNKLNGNVFFEYEVCDGQQRLRTISDFIEDKFTLGKGVFSNGQDISNKKYSELNPKQKTDFLNYKLTIAIIIESTQEEIRDLFARLQKGMGLNQAELRRALSSNIGIYVESLVNNHRFFLNCGIPDIRYKHQDYIDHIIAYLVNAFNKDFKGIFLKDVYEVISAEQATVFVKQISNVLDQMEKINSIHLGIFKNKWGFVDAFILINHFLKQDRKVSAKMFVDEFIRFEKLRKANNRNPRNLVENVIASDEDKRLYTYITSFQKDGALKNNMKKRNEVFLEQFGYLFE